MAVIMINKEELNLSGFAKMEQILSELPTDPIGQYNLSAEDPGARLETIVGPDETPIAEESLLEKKDGVSNQDIANYHYSTGQHLTFDLSTAKAGIIKAANREDKTVPVTLNVSVKSAQNSEFFEEIDKLVQEYSLKPQDIIFEILEHDVDPDADVSHLQTLKDQGYRFALDDLDVGLSHYDRLNVFGEYIDFIKFDGSCIRGFLNEIGVVNTEEPNTHYDYEEGDLELLLEAIDTYYNSRYHLPVPALIAEHVHEKKEVEFLRELGFCGFQSHYSKQNKQKAQSDNLANPTLS